MTYSLKLTIPGLPKTTNGNARKHWRALQNEATKWHKIVFLAIGSNKPATPLERARLIFTRHSSQRPDHDGLVSSWKHVQDALIKSGIIVNDKYENIGEPKYLWELAPIRKGFITIHVEGEE